MADPLNVLRHVFRRRRHKLRLLTRIAFVFRSPDALIGLAMLAHDGLCPPLPGGA
jgi:hypothetical protein